MIKKLLKIELYVLFILTILSFIFFYYGSSLPDNLLSISSRQSTFNLFTFYSSSAIAYIGYFIGPWVFFTFIVFALFYSLMFNHRNLSFDPLNFFFLLIQNVLLFYIFSPSFLGEGLTEIIKTNFTYPSQIAYLIIFTLLFLVTTYRTDFFKLNLILLHRMKNILSILFRSLSNFHIGNFVQNNKNQLLNKIENLKLPISKQLQNGKSIHESPFVSNNIVTEVLPVVKSSTLSKINPFLNLEKEKNITKEVKQNTDSPKSKIQNKNYFEVVNNIPVPENKLNVKHPDDIYFNDIVSRIENKLNEFKIEGTIVNILKGPVVDTYELELGTGVRISKVINSEKDLSMALFGAPIRIVYPMIGRTTVGIEVPRNPREIIYLDELLSTNDFKNNHSHLPIIMGKDAFGQPFLKDLAAMPHMLVAGSTGSGKSVFINTILVSLLVKKSPDKMKLILIDPKQLELALYAKLPHLLLPVVTKARDASISLLWAVEEMERRYTLLKDMGVRNIEGFNSKIKKAGPDLMAVAKHHYDEADDNSFELPYIVIIVDEFADLILTKSGKEIETNICRLAAKARAAGIHLVLATQRPSVDVVTGLIKANFPIRVSFKVSSSTDSRTILDSKGAEKLLGKGDMIFKHGTTTGRIHSSYIGEEEIEVLAKNLEAIGTTFNSEAMSFLENQGEESSVTISTESGPLNISGSDASKDDLFKEAIKVVMEQKTASASMLQRRLRIGYNRAANLIEEMEEKGIVGPAEGSKRRKVLVLSE